MDAGSWIAASTRRIPEHLGQTKTSIPSARCSNSAQEYRRRPDRSLHTQHQFDEQSNHRDSSPSALAACAAARANELSSSNSACSLRIASFRHASRCWSAVAWADAEPMSGAGEGR
jgi:hypothetical protein